MIVAADTNILVRAITGDNPNHSRRARQALAEAEAVVVSLPVFCELAWVLATGYGFGANDIEPVIADLLDSVEVATERPASKPVSRSFARAATSPTA